MSWIRRYAVVRCVVVIGVRGVCRVFLVDRGAGVVSGCIQDSFLQLVVRPRRLAELIVGGSVLHV